MGGTVYGIGNIFKKIFIYKRLLKPQSQRGRRPQPVINIKRRDSEGNTYSDVLVSFKKTSDIS